MWKVHTINKTKHLIKYWINVLASFLWTSNLNLVKSMFKRVGLTCRAAAFEIQDGSKQGVLFKASYDVSFAFPQSTTNTTSLIVILVSAIFVAKTIFLTPSSGLSNINLWMKRKRIRIKENANHWNKQYRFTAYF